jgi:DNA-binding response OmpR family regulator
MTAAPQDAPSIDAKTRGRVLVVEDDAHIRDLVVLHLQLEGLTTVAVGDGAAGLRLAKQDPFDLLVLDVMLPELDGVTVCRAVRREPMNGDVPILMLTARREETDKVLGLESGADDYLTKPFGVREFIARVRALLRRRPSRTSDHAAAISAAGLTVDPARRHARLDAVSAREQPRHRLQPRLADAEGLGRRHAHHGAERRYAREARAQED